jgi:hypothetical protein
MSDQDSDLEQILNGEQPEPEAVETPEIPEPEQAEAPAEVEQVPEPEKEPEPQTVPVGVVQELRRELRELKAAQQRQPEAPAPDVFENPDGYREHMQNSIRAAVNGTKLETSRFIAEREFGKEVVDAAFEHFNQHPEQSAALLQHPSPFHAAVEHYNKQRVAQEIGSDPDAYKAKVEAELRKQIEAEMVAKQARDMGGRYAPSMANVTGTGGGPKANWTGPTPLNSVIGE